MINGQARILIQVGLSLLLVFTLFIGTVTVAQAANGPTETLFACRRCSGGGGGGGGGGSGGGSGQLSQVEIDGLNYMREEEKLARDVYLTLYDVWHLLIFSNISGSESMHMARIKELLDRYNLPDPAAGNSIGEFTNPDLQYLYDDLVAKGQLSKTDALQVGVAVEEVDISDLQRFLALTIMVISKMFTATC